MAEKKRRKQSFEYGAVILLCSTMLVKLIGAVFKIPLSDLIGDLGFGYFSSAYDLFTPIYTIAMAGLPIAVSRVVAEHAVEGRYKDVRQSLTITRRLFWITGIAGFLLMLALIYPFVKLTDKTSDTIYSLFAISPSLLFCCVMSTYRGYYEGLRNMYPTAVSDITEALGKLILGYGFAYIVMKVSGNVAFAAAAAILGITVGAAIAALYLWLRYRISGDGITEEELAASPEKMNTRAATRALIAIAIPVVMASLANSVASLVDVVMVKWQLSHLMGSHADSILKMYAASIADYNTLHSDPLVIDAIPTFLYGVRSKAFTIYNLVPAITSVLGVSALPVLASSWVKHAKPAVKQNIESMIKVSALIACPAGLGFLFMGSGIMTLMYNTVASVEIGGVMMSIYGAAALFAGISIPMTSMLQAIGKQVISLRNVAVGAVLKVVVNFACVSIPTLNVKGAAIGTFVCYAFIFFANFISLIHYSGVRPDIFKILGKPFLSALGCGITAFVMYRILGNGKITAVLSIGSAAVVYLILLVVFNTFEESDVISLPKGDKILRVFKKLRIIR